MPEQVQHRHRHFRQWVGGVTSQNLAGGDGYALVVPAGTYQLQDGECTGRATVIAGRLTVADTDCDFP